MKIVIQGTHGETIVEFPPDVFRKLLQTYLARNNNDVNAALDQIEAELKALTITA